MTCIRPLAPKKSRTRKASRKAKKAERIPGLMSIPVLEVLLPVLYPVELLPIACVLLLVVLAVSPTTSPPHDSLDMEGTPIHHSHKGTKRTIKGKPQEYSHQGRTKQLSRTVKLNNCQL